MNNSSAVMKNKRNPQGQKHRKKPASEYSSPKGRSVKSMTIMSGTTNGGNTINSRLHSYKQAKMIIMK